MNQIRGFCNRICNECPVFKATKADDDQERASMAAAVSIMFDLDFNPDDVNCDGCIVQGGTLYKFCMKCAIRNREIHNGGG